MRLIETAGSSKGARPSGVGPYLALQGLRAAAAFLVVVDHALIAGTDTGLLGAEFRPFAAFVGLLGVYVFFVISGVVMMLGHGGDFGRPGAGLRFAARRVSRIVPLYWLATILVVLLRPNSASLAKFIKSLLFIPHQMTGGPYGWPLYPLGWTLQYEMLFYLLFALALGFGRRLGLALLAGAILLLALAAAAGLLGTHTIPAFFGHPVILYFLAGIGIGLAVPRLLAGSRWTPGFGTALALACAPLAAACAVAFRYGAQSLSALAAAAVAAMLAVAVCALHGPSTPDTRWRKLAHALGDATYSIYLTHAFVVFGFGRLVARSGLDLPFVLFLPAAMAASALVGLAIYRWLERPLVRALGRLLGQRPGIGGRPV
ncbi:MAG TPA: acyltransferase [Allosphingosinicella sp.]